VAASFHGDTPYSGKTVTSVPVTPYTTSVHVNRLAFGITGGVRVHVMLSPADLNVALARRLEVQEPLRDGLRAAHPVPTMR
jgi:hypothetical protein